MGHFSKIYAGGLQNFVSQLCRFCAYLFNFCNFLDFFSWNFVSVLEYAFLNKILKYNFYAFLVFIFVKQFFMYFLSLLFIDYN